jgi:protease-4
MASRKRLLLVWAVVGFALSAAAQETVPGQSAGAVAPAPVAPVRYAEIEIDGLIAESLPDLYLVEPELDTVYDLVQRIEQARRDAAVRGVLVKLGDIDAGWAKVQEIRHALLRCREAGKEVVCFLEGGGNLQYYLASAADRVVMPPGASLLIVGLRAEVVFFKGLMDKLGVAGDLVQVGDYKGAAEPFTRTQASEQFRSSMNGLLDDYYRQLVAGIASGRGMAPEAVSALLDQGPFTAKRAVESRLVDALMFYDELPQELEQRHGHALVVAHAYGKGARQPARPLGGGAQQLLKLLFGAGRSEQLPPETAAPTIAVIYAVGPIVMEEPDVLGLGDWIVSA